MEQLTVRHIGDQDSIILWNSVPCWRSADPSSITIIPLMIFVILFDRSELIELNFQNKDNLIKEISGVLGFWGAIRIVPRFKQLRIAI